MNSHPASVYHRPLSTPIGSLLATVDTDGQLTELRFDAEVPAAPGQPPSTVVDALDQIERQLTEYFGQSRREFTLRIAPSGTEFQRGVWRALQDLSWGQTESYGDLARRIDHPKAVRAVGRANGANPIPIVVPCHRVVGADGSLTGYAGGVDRKRWLLEHEGVRPRQHTLPT